MRSPSVLFLTLSPQDYQGAGGRTRIVSEIRYAIGDRYPVTLLCLVALRKWLHPLQLLRARRALAEDAGVLVLYVPKIPTLGLRVFEPVAKFLNRLSLGVAVLLRGARIVHAHGATAADLALGVQHVLGRRFLVADLHGVDSAEAMHRQGQTTLDAGGRRQLARELGVVRRADRIVVVSNALRRYYEEEAGLTLEGNLLLPCLTRLSPEIEATSRAARRRELGFEGRTVFLYVGSVRAYQCVDETLRLYRALSEDLESTALLILTSHGEAFEHALEASGVDREHVHVRSARQADVHQWIQLADFGFLLREDALVNRVASPTKFAEYVVNGCSVITTPFVGDYSALVEAQALGVCVAPPFEPPAGELLDLVRRYASAPAPMRECCRAYGAEHLSWERAGPCLPELYDELLGRARLSS